MNLKHKRLFRQNGMRIKGLGLLIKPSMAKDFDKLVQPLENMTISTVGKKLSGGSILNTMSFKTKKQMNKNIQFII